MKFSTALLFSIGLAFGGVAHAASLGAYYVETGFGDTVSRLNVNDDITAATNDVLRSNANGDPRAIAIDHDNLRIYFANGNAIYRTDFAGTSQSLVTTTVGGPGDIEIDSANGKLYFSTGSGTPADRRIMSVNTDGTGMTTIHDASTLATNNPLDPTITTKDIANISLDLTNSLLYWTADNGANAGVIGLNSSPLAGGAATQHFVGTSRSDSISKMDIDFENSTVYYTVGSTTNEVRSSTIAGGGVTTLASGVGRPSPIALDLDNDKLYFAVGGTMYQSDLDGTDRLSKEISGSSLFNIADIEVAVPEPGSAALLALGGLLLARRRRGG